MYYVQSQEKRQMNTAFPLPEWRIQCQQEMKLVANNLLFVRGNPRDSGPPQAGCACGS